MKLQWRVVLGWLIVILAAVPTSVDAREPTPADRARPSPSADPDEPAIRHLMDTYGLDEATARRRRTRENRFEALMQQLGDEFAAGWAGAWIDHDDGGRVTVNVVDDATAAAVRAHLAHEDLVDVRTVPFGTAELPYLSACRETPAVADLPS